VAGVFKIKEIMNKFSQYPALSALIQAGASLHAFRSGGGLRVVTICPQFDQKKGLGGYGEHPYIYDALAIAEEDAIAGGREYEEVYGENKLHPHYLTGDSTPAGGLDAWVLCGRSFDIVFENKMFVFESTYVKQRKTPQWVIDALHLDQIHHDASSGFINLTALELRGKKMDINSLPVRLVFATGK
jgi:hypothetical protein